MIKKKKSALLFAAFLGAAFYLVGKLILLPAWGVPVRIGTIHDIVAAIAFVAIVSFELLRRPEKS
jgi:hypothetical protein